MEKYINEEGKVGVIVSPDYGAGWSTWGYSPEFLSMDKTLVQMCLNKDSASKVEEYIKAATGKRQCTLDWSGCRVEFVEKGQLFTIFEYDGSETIKLISDIAMTA